MLKYKTPFRNFIHFLIRHTVQYFFYNLTTEEKRLSNSRTLSDARSFLLKALGCWREHSVVQGHLQRTSSVPAPTWLFTTGTLVRRKPMPSSGLCGHNTHSAHTYTHKVKIFPNKHWENSSVSFIPQAVF